MRCFRWVAIAVLGLWSFAAGAGETIIVTHNKAHILRLNQDISGGTLINTNPTVLEAQLHSTRMAVLWGLAAGETQLIILDKQQNEVFSAVVVVTPELERHVSVIRNCGEGGGNACLTEEELNCGPRCVRVPVPGTKEAVTAGGTGGGGGSSGGGDSGATDAAGAAAGGAAELQ